MVSPSTLFLSVLGLGAGASAQLLGVVREVHQKYSGGSSGICYGANLYTIQEFPNGFPTGSSGCSTHGMKHLATSQRSSGQQLEGCHGGYSNGWSVCVTGYGANVYNGRGQHQRCHTVQPGPRTIVNCPTALYCNSIYHLEMTCDGHWVQDP
ncbi:hypothetical protein QBC40DRAFT_252683 [Triangularia verruculosa]|uniref:Secreted protein n=1 Tax=Triangularia verruculosa TaxID=2587418 RepID=A0AAN7AYI3_9PEZI|nr:hypothetical protein QBC40DRAFT_252683 [Triangularia verruculosa]